MRNSAVTVLVALILLVVLGTSSIGVAGAAHSVTAQTGLVALASYEFDDPAHAYDSVILGKLVQTSLDTDVASPYGIGTALRPQAPAHLYDFPAFFVAPRGGGNGTLYRGLADGEDPALGLVARNPDANITPSQHVFGTRDSQWISTTRDPAVAAETYGEHGWVAIDASRVTGPVVDVSGGVPAHVPGHNCMFCNAARAHQEVLI